MCDVWYVGVYNSCKLKNESSDPNELEREKVHNAVILACMPNFVKKSGLNDSILFFTGTGSSQEIHQGTPFPG